MLVKYINKLNVSYFSVHYKCFFLNGRHNLVNFAKCLISNHSTSNLVQNDKISPNKFILNNNIVINVKTIANSPKFPRKVKDGANDWDLVNNYDYVCLNIHEDDIGLIKPIIDEKLRNSGRENKIKNYKSILKQYDEYISVLNNVIKYGKRYCLIGLNRRLELSNFGNVIMNNKKEIPKLFYLLLRYKNILTNSDGLNELRELCPNTYNFLILGKANHCFSKLLHFLKDVMINHKNDSKVSILVVVETHLKEHLLNQMGANFGLKRVNLDEIESLVNQTKLSLSLNASENMKNWSLFLGLYLFLPSLVVCLIIANLVFYYLYTLKRGQHISISLYSPNFNNPNNHNNLNKDNGQLFGDKEDKYILNMNNEDKLGLRIDLSRKNRRIKLGKNAKFYDPERD